ncbi:histone H1-like [Oratosquilla oratoria]|uniref:histone H1-like n=1 Tax=Oratosquilla oratoria TaxID=337810 RepID=UPI003F777968
MTETAAKPAKAKKPQPKPIHPPYSVMIPAALNALKERTGSSRQAILRYIVANYKINDVKKSGVRLNMALKKMVASGALSQVKGTGASGSFKLPKEGGAAAPKKPAKKTPKAKKPAVKKSPVKKPAPKKAIKKSPKKAAKKVGKKPAPKKAKK